MNHPVNRLYALCLLAALVAAPLTTRVISHQRNCAQKSPGIERTWTKPRLIAIGTMPHPPIKTQPKKPVG